MRIKHLVVGLVVALLCVVGLAACGDDDDSGSSSTPAATSTGDTAAAGQIDASKPEVRIALVGISIPGINLLEKQELGAKAAVEKMNNEGGIGGRKVVLDVCNSKAQPTTATTCARSLVAKNPVAQFGCEITWAATGLRIFASKGIPSFNCVNLPEDFSNEYSFGIHPGAFGDDRAKARWICTQDQIKKATVVTQDIPQQHSEVPAAFGDILKDCGKELGIVYYAPTAADFTPVIQRVIKDKPDFIMSNVSGPQVVPFVQGFKNQGFKGEQLGMGESAWDYETVVKPLGDALEGAYYFGGWKAWNDDTDSDMKDYFAAMQAAGNSEDAAKDPNAQYGYAEAMFFKAAGVEIGPDKLDAASLKEFASTNNTMHIPLARTMVNPGPEGFPQVKQPYAQVAQYKGGKLTPVGPDDGWVNGF